MVVSQIYLLISVIILFVIVIFVFFINKNQPKKRITLLTSLSFIFIILGMFFGENRLLGYSLIGVGVLFAVFDIIKKESKKWRN